MKLAVLATDEQEIVEDQSGTVPVVVPPGWRDVERVQRPEFGQFVTVEGDDPVVVVPTARVEQRESVGVDRHRALDDVARAKVGEQPFAGAVVEDVDVAAVGAEGDPCLLAALPDRRLSSPAGAAPVDDLLADRRVGAHRLVGEPPSDLGSCRYRSLAVVRARGVPRKVSSPSTVSPYGRPEERGSTQPSYGGSVVVVVVVVVDVVVVDVVEMPAVVVVVVEMPAVSSSSPAGGGEAISTPTRVIVRARPMRARRVAREERDKCVKQRNAVARPIVRTYPSNLNELVRPTPSWSCCGGAAEPARSVVDAA